MPSLASVDFNQTPFVAIWETTRACDLACRHCRAEAISEALPGELTTEEGFGVLDHLSEMGTPICVLSGGDPAKRQDLCELISYGSKLGMRMATIPAATPLLTRELVFSLKEAGLAQMAMSLDGPTADVHDTFRGVPGAFDRTIAGAGFAREAQLPMQINTVFSSYNLEHFKAMTEIVGSLGAVFWEVFFLVPMGRGKDLGQMNAEQFEFLFTQLAEYSHQVNFIVKITEAPHYRRYLMQEHARHQRDGNGSGPDEHPAPTPPMGHPGGKTGMRPPGMKREKGELPWHMRRDFGPGGSIGLAPKGVNAGNGHLFVSYCGDVYPSGFLALPCGNIREGSLTEIYRTHPVFKELRDLDLLKGKCGICEFRHICAGSRARAFSMTGDYLAEEPFCAYEPPAGSQ
ncbi:MAG: radical SAM protein [Acidobacteriota bacterium]|nr:MAG: radical SAM protein [Acidobacteriota bacterium]